MSDPRPNGWELAHTPATVFAALQAAEGRVVAAEQALADAERALRVAAILGDLGCDMQNITDWVGTLGSEESIIAWWGADEFDGRDMDDIRQALRGD